MVEKKILSELYETIGKEKVEINKNFLVTYSYDSTGQKHLPDIIVFPHNEEDVKEILKIASKYMIPVTPRGAGVGYSGGAVPVKGGISLVFTKMNRIINIDKKNMLAVVEPGVITQNLHVECERAGLFYPPDPASLKTSTLGGNVSENAGGPRCFKYGVTSNYVLALEGYLISGEKVKFGTSTIKDVSGYDIKHLITGSEGTLIVITRIFLRLIPKPDKDILVKLNFNSLWSGSDFINKVIGANLSPSVLEFIDRTSIEAVYDYINIPLNKKLNSVVLIEFDGSVSEIEKRISKLRTMINNSDILSYEIAESSEEKEKLWSIRRNISPAIANIKPKKINEDIAVPIGEIPDTVRYISKLSEETGIKIIMFGHFGDGNIHTNLMIDPENREEVKKCEYLLDKIFKHVISVNGTISGEHGIGISKKAFLKYQYGETEIELFKRIKKVFDPHGLLNPGKIF
ncbi:MAG: FAD-linked oxidase C-terminal domain-containing protein [Acidobacteriota bacterium]